MALHKLGRHTNRGMYNYYYRLKVVKPQGGITKGPLSHSPYGSTSRKRTYLT